MDCPTEERLVRMKLDGFPQVHTVSFNLEERKLTVLHSGPPDPLFKSLDSLNLGTSLESSVPSEGPVSIQTDEVSEKKLLWQVLLINGFFFLLECGTGLLSGSMGLVADGLDMLADSLIYGLALLAVGRSLSRKKTVAALAGYSQILLALAGFSEVLRRLTGAEAAPDFLTMIGISMLALAGNSLCLFLLKKTDSTGVHMKATLIFTSSDIWVNLGVILAGGLVFITGSSIPDLIVGSLVLILVLKGALAILKLSR